MGTRSSRGIGGGGRASMLLKKAGDRIGVFHGSFGSSLSSILTEGLRPGISGKVFLSTSKKDALDWGRIRAKKKGDEFVALVELKSGKGLASVPYGEDSFRVTDRVLATGIKKVSLFRVSDIESWIYGNGKEPKPI